MTANIRDYGAVGGGADDTAAVAAAIATGDTVLVPDGVYSVSKVSLTGVGQVLTGTGTLKLGTSVGDDYVLQMAAANQQITGITVDGSSVPNTWGVGTSGNRAGQVISGVHFVHIGTAGFYILGAPTHLSIDACYFTGHGYGVLAEAHSTPDYVFVTNNICVGQGGGGDPINFNNEAGAGAQHVTITGNKCSGYSGYPYSGLGIALAHVLSGLISGNVVTDMDTNGIHIEDRSTDIVVMGNRVERIGMGGIQIGGAGTARVSVLGNEIENAALSSGAGIAVVGADPVLNCSIIGNVVVASNPDPDVGIQAEWGAIHHANAVVTANPTPWGVNAEGVFVYPAAWITDANRAVYLTGGVPNQAGYGYLGTRLAFALVPPNTGLVGL